MTSPARGRALLDEQTSERQFQDRITQYADLRGWAWYHTHDSRRSPSGFPDLILARRLPTEDTGRAIAAELKSMKGRITPSQRHWLEVLGWCGLEPYLWRPSDWETIVEVLK